MKKISFNTGWTVRCLTREMPAKEVTLPHDAMISEPRSAESTGGANIGWFIGGDYEYTKRFTAPPEWMGCEVLAEFEGVYHNAEVYLNGEKICGRPYGYTNFYADFKEALLIGEENELKVIAHNADQPNSRWYTGTGIYRPVSIWTGGEKHIRMNGVRIRTIDHEERKIEVLVAVSTPGEIKLEILDGERTVAVRSFTGTKKKVRFTLNLPGAKLWDPETPNLYTARVTFGDDTVTETFGIRSLKWDKTEGLTLNGRRLLLRGACVHHDNGILGACAFPEAEERKVRILKENGYNAIRSAHNPCSKAMLDACDRLGVLMLDEYVDMWTIHKTKYDYASYTKACWKEDLKDMVEKDFNHPCVIGYSIGNEVTETAQPDGIAFAGEMTDYLHTLDSTRPVTCGINIFLNFLSSMGLGIYKEGGSGRASEAASHRRKTPLAGSEFYNKLAGITGERFMKSGASLRRSDAKTREAFAKLDIAGYNYGISRYEKDIIKYPDRLILGTETFCADTWQFRAIAKDNPRLIGDFVWSGFDYLGETNLGAPEYGNYRMDADEYQITGSNGRIDITGKRRAEAAYTLAAYGLAGPFIAVCPVDRSDYPGLTSWTMTRALESWSFGGFEGRPAEVEVYSDAAEVELFLNGESIERKKTSRTARTMFSLPYIPGTLTAAAYDENGEQTGTCTLESASEHTELRILPEEDTVKAGGLAFVRLRYTDENGIWKPLERHTLKIEVEGGELLGFGSGNCFTDTSYVTDTTDTYYGEALAVIRAGREGGIRINVSEDEIGRYAKGYIAVR